jgi:peptidoglycan L-alanyl-D-glutamate endopeptidase CwlK
MSGFSFSHRSERNLRGVHPDLVRVVRRALQLSPVDFTVVEGLRTKKRQAELLKAGASRTMNSRHLTGHAVDLAPFIGGRIRWDWPPFHLLAKAMKTAAAELGVAIVWGGDWRTFKDGPHFELDRKAYP